MKNAETSIDFLPYKFKYPLLFTYAQMDRSRIEYLKEPRIVLNHLSRGSDFKLAEMTSEGNSAEFDIAKPKDITKQELAKYSRHVNLKKRDGAVRIYKVRDYFLDDPKSAEVVYYKMNGKLYQEVIPAGDDFQEGLLTKFEKELQFYLNLSFNLKQQIQEKQVFSQDLLDLDRALGKITYPIKSDFPNFLEVFENLKKYSVGLYIKYRDSNSSESFFAENSSTSQYQQEITTLSAIITAQTLIGATQDKEKQRTQNQQEKQTSIKQGISVSSRLNTQVGKNMSIYDIEHCDFQNYGETSTKTPNVCYIKIKRTDGSARNHRDLTIKDDNGNNEEEKNAYCFVKVSFDSKGQAKLDTKFIYYSSENDRSQKKQLLLSDLDDANRQQIFDDLNHITINTKSKIATVHDTTAINFKKQAKDFTTIGDIFKTEHEKSEGIVRTALGKNKQYTLAKILNELKQEAEARKTSRDQEKDIRNKYRISVMRSAFGRYSDHARERKVLKATAEIITGKSQQKSLGQFFKGFKEVVQREKEVEAFSKRNKNKRFHSAFQVFKGGIEWEEIDKKEQEISQKVEIFFKSGHSNSSARSRNTSDLEDTLVQEVFGSHRDFNDDDIKAKIEKITDIVLLTQSLNEVNRSKSSEQTNDEKIGEQSKEIAELVNELFDPEKQTEANAQIQAKNAIFGSVALSLKNQVARNELLAINEQSKAQRDHQEESGYLSSATDILGSGSESDEDAKVSPPTVVRSGDTQRLSSSRTGSDLLV